MVWAVNALAKAGGGLVCCGMQRKAQQPELDEFSRKWFVELAEEICALKRRGRSNPKRERNDLAQAVEWVASFSAFTHHLALSMTDNEDHAFTAARLVWRRFLYRSIRDAEDSFLIPERRMIREADIRRRLGKWFTVFHRMPRVWVYHQCQEALGEIELRFHAVEKMPPDEQYQHEAGRPPLDQVPGNVCPVNERGHRPRLVPTDRCVRACRVLFLRWMCFSEEEIGAAVDVPRSTVARLAERCTTLKPWQKLNDLLDQQRGDSPRDSMP